MGYTSDVTNTINGKKYLISTTALGRRTSMWETAVLKRTLFGIPNMLRPLLRVITLDEKQALFVHGRVEEIVAQRDPTEWEPAKWALMNDDLDATTSQAPSDGELRSLALHGEVAEAIVRALARDMERALDARDFETHLAQFRQEGSRALMRHGYRLRLAEQKIMLPRQLVPQGQVDEILRSNKSPREKTEAITQYLDTHDSAGLGEPIRPYTLARFDEIQEVCERFVGKAIESNRIPKDERQMQIGLYQGYVAYGYVYRVAEELVREHIRATESASNGASSSAGLSAIAEAVTNEDKSAAEDNSKLWGNFRGKPNTEAVLKEKANALTTLITSNCDFGLALASAMKDNNPEIRLGDEEARQALAETAALLLSVVDRTAFQFLGSKNRDAFMDALEVGVARVLQEKGMEPESFLELLGKRYEEYAHYPKWVFEKDESAKDTLFWEFAKKIAINLNVGLDPVFNLTLTEVLLKAFLSWKLNELLPDDQKLD